MLLERKLKGIEKEEREKGERTVVRWREEGERERGRERERSEEKRKGVCVCECVCVRERVQILKSIHVHVYLHVCMQCTCFVHSTKYAQYLVFGYQRPYFVYTGTRGFVHCSVNRMPISCVSSYVGTYTQHL